MIETLGFIKHERGGKVWDHPNDILTRLECDACIKLIKPLLLNVLREDIKALARLEFVELRLRYYD